MSLLLYLFSTYGLEVIVQWLFQTQIPFHLDYKANEILDSDFLGIYMSGQQFPLGADQSVCLEYLKTLGVGYVFWQTGGHATRQKKMLEATIAMNTHQSAKMVVAHVYFLESLSESGSGVELIHKDKVFTLYKL